MINTEDDLITLNNKHYLILLTPTSAAAASLDLTFLPLFTSMASLLPRSLQYTLYYDLIISNSPIISARRIKVCLKCHLSHALSPVTSFCHLSHAPSRLSLTVYSQGTVLYIPPCFQVRPLPNK